jgi:hypothetical protein
VSWRASGVSFSCWREHRLHTQPTQTGQFYGWGVHVASVSQHDIFQIGVHGADAGSGIGDAWFRVDASDLTYGWTLYSVEPFMKTSQTAPPATIVGFGCSGQPFHYDAFEFGAPGAVTTLDFETARTQLTAGPGGTITAGQKATLTGTTTAHM